MSRLATRGLADMSTPLTPMLPASGRRAPLSMEILVDLPAPFGPRKPRISAWPTRTSRSSTTVRVP